MPASRPRRASRRRWSAPSPSPRRAAAGWFGKVVKPERQRHQQCRHLRRQGRQAGRRRDQRRHRLRLHQGRGAQPRGRLRDRDRRGLSRRPSRRRKDEVKDDEGDTAEVTFTPHAVLSAVQAGRGRARRAARDQGAEACSASSRTICSRTAASMPTGSTSTASRPSPSAPARPRSTPSRNMSNLAGIREGCRLGVLLATLED